MSVSQFIVADLLLSVCGAYRDLGYPSAIRVEVSMKEMTANCEGRTGRFNIYTSEERKPIIHVIIAELQHITQR